MSRSFKPAQLTAAALMAAVLCILGPLTVPIGPVPVSLCTLGLYLSLYAVAWPLPVLSCAVYLLLGLVGLPVFSGFAGGAARLMGPTGGYLIGYLPMVLLAGLLLRRFRQPWQQVLAMVLGTAVLYAFGTAWYCVQAHSPLGAALAVCVAPFIPFDLVKIILAAVLGPVLQRRLKAAGVQ